MMKGEASSSGTAGIKNLSEWAAQIAGRVDSFMKQRAIVALLMLYEGVMLLVQSQDSTRAMATGIAVAIALAAGGILAEALAKRGGGKKAVIPAVLAAGLAVYCLFQPDMFAGILRYLIAASVLMTGLLNLAQAFGISKLRMQGNLAEGEAAAPAAPGEGGNIAGTIRKTVKNEIDKHIGPARILLGSLGKSVAAVWITGFLMTALGIVLFFRSVEGNTLLSVVSGVLMIFTSLADLVAAYRMKQALKTGQPDRPDQ